MDSMLAMQLDASGKPFRPVERPVPRPGPHEVRLAVSACGACRTDLHIADGDIRAVLPIVPGHEIVGRIEALGSGVEGFRVGDRVGVPWLGHACGTWSFCASGSENLCDRPVFTGSTRDGGFATHCQADARFCFALPDEFDDLHAAPLLCAGQIGFRAWRMAGDAPVLGLYGFCAAVHILAQLAVAEGRKVSRHARGRWRGTALRDRAGLRLGGRFGPLAVRADGRNDHLRP